MGTTLGHSQEDGTEGEIMTRTLLEVTYSLRVEAREDGRNDTS